MSEYISSEQLAQIGEAEYKKLQELESKAPLTNKDRMASAGNACR